MKFLLKNFCLQWFPDPEAARLATPDPKLFDQVRKHGLTGVLGFGKRLKG
jgi:hypothetical protein